MKKSTLLFALIWLSIAQTWAQSDRKPSEWAAWLIPDVQAHLLAAPPKTPETAAVLDAQRKLDSTMRQQIAYWHVGAPSYRWEAIMQAHWMSDAHRNGLRASLLLSVATYDALVVAQRTQTAHPRPRPYEANKKIVALVPKTEDPSYPCAYSVAAGVGATVIGHFFPALADSMQRLAQQVMDARVAAGMAYPSDTRAGFELGKKIATLEIETTKDWLNNTPWAGKMPDQPGLWKGNFAFLPNAGKSKTFTLDSPQQFRPGPPPDYAKDMAELKAYQPSFDQLANACKYSTESVSSDLLHLKILEYNLHLQPLKAAQAYALTAIAIYDSFVACWDAKYTYWGLRPDQYDPTYKPTLPDPPFPGYPSGHACSSAAVAQVMAALFPSERALFEQSAKNAAEARFQVGVHFRTDNEVGLELGKKVGLAVVKKAGL